MTEDYRFYVEQYQVMRTDLDGRNKRQIYDAGGDSLEVVAATERELVIWNRSSVPRMYYIMDLDGGNIREWLE